MGTVQQSAPKQQPPPSSTLTYDPFIGTWRPKFEGEVARGRELAEQKRLAYVREVRRGEEVGGKQLEYRRGKLYIVREKTVTSGQEPITGQVYDVKSGRFVKGVPKATIAKQPERYIQAKAQYYSAQGMPLKGVPQATVEKRDYGKAYIYQSPTPQPEEKTRLERLTERARGIEEKYIDPQFQKLSQVERAAITKAHQKLPPFFTSGPIKRAAIDPTVDTFVKGPYQFTKGLLIGTAYIPSGMAALPHSAREFYQAPRAVKKQKVKGVVLAAAQRPALTAGVIGSGYFLGTGIARGFRKISPSKVTTISASQEVAYTTKGGVTTTRIVGKGAAKVGRTKYVYKKGAVIQTYKVAGAEKPLGLRIRKGQIQKPPAQTVPYQYGHLGGGAVRIKKTSGFIGKKPVTQKFATVGGSKTIVPEYSYKSVAFSYTPDKIAKPVYLGPKQYAQRLARKGEFRLYETYKTPEFVTKPKGGHIAMGEHASMRYKGKMEPQYIWIGKKPITRLRYREPISKTYRHELLHHHLVKTKGLHTEADVALLEKTSLFKKTPISKEIKPTQLGIGKTFVTEKYKIPRKQQLITREKTISRTYGKPKVTGKHVTDTLHFDPPKVLPKVPTKLELQYKPPLPQADILGAHRARVLIPRERASGTALALGSRVRTIKAQKTRLGLRKAVRQRQYLKTAPRVAVKQAQGLFLGGRLIQSQVQKQKVGLVQKVKPVQRQKQITRLLPPVTVTKTKPIAPFLPLGIGYQKRRRPRKRPRARRPRYKRRATLLPIPDLLSVELSVGKYGKATTPRPTKKVRKEFLGKYRRNPFVYRFPTVEQRRGKKRKRGVKLF